VVEIGGGAQKVVGTKVKEENGKIATETDRD
jgi:hypothetical protein